MSTRKITSEYRMSQWAEMIQERMSSGETIAEFCTRKGVNKWAYFYWLKKLREAAGKELTRQQSQETSLSVPGFAEVKVKEVIHPSMSIGSDQICIETGLYKITANSGYPAEILVSVLREIVIPCRI